MWYFISFSGTKIDNYECDHECKQLDDQGSKGFPKEFGDWMYGRKLRDRVYLTAGGWMAGHHLILFTGHKQLQLLTHFFYAKSLNVFLRGYNKDVKLDPSHHIDAAFEIEDDHEETDYVISGDRLFRVTDEVNLHYEGKIRNNCHDTEPDYKGETLLHSS